MNPAIKGPLLLIGMTWGPFVTASGSRYERARRRSAIRRRWIHMSSSGAPPVEIETRLLMIGRDYETEKGSASV